MKINADGTEIAIITGKDDNSDYISLTDIAKRKNLDSPADVIKNWLRSRSTLEYLGLWEQLNNPDFKLVDFDQFLSQAGANAFVMSPQKWISGTNAIGLISKSGRNGGTFAHSDIAMEFASWISPEFKLYIIKDYQRLKLEEAKRLEIGWDTKRALTKINYKIHTDAIKEFLITPELTAQEKSYTYANEADILNVALFGKTAKQFRDETGNKRQNMRDFASVEELIVLVNLESMNAEMIREGKPANERVARLRSIAYHQLNSLINSNAANLIQNSVKKRIGQNKFDN